MDVNKLLDDLEDYIEHRPKQLFRHALFVNIEDVLDFTQQIRVSLPPQIQKADQITRERERILQEAHEQAERIRQEAAEQAELAIRKAQDEARILITNHEITRQAQQEGQRIVEQAKQEGEAIRQGALEYARNVMGKLNEAIGKVSDHVTQLRSVAQQVHDDIKV